jgi:hypothetical protein
MLDLASDVMRIATRPKGGVSVLGELETVQLADAKGVDSELAPKLKSISTSNAEEAPLALIKFVENSIDADIPISDETRTILESYIQTFRGKALEQELLAALAQANAQPGKFKVALSLSKDLPSQSQKQIHEIIFQKLVSNANDYEFSNVAFEFGQMTRNLNPSLTLDIAERLLQNGFVTHAKKIVSTNTKIEKGQRSDLLYALIALKLGNFELAKSLAEEHPGDPSTEIRTRANSALGIFENLNDTSSLSSAQTALTHHQWMSISEEKAESSATEAQDIAIRLNLEANQGSTNDVSISLASSIADAIDSLESDVLQLLSADELDISAISQ